MTTAAPPLIVLGGPTATGKTGLAIELALDLGRPDRPIEVLSADSRQVYRGMDIATAKPTLTDRRGVRHHLLDLVDPPDPFSVAHFVAAARLALAEIAARQGVGLLVGGTGFWIRAIADGLAIDEVPSDPTLREQLDDRLATEGLTELADELTRRAPRLATRTDLRNPRRVARALEIATLQGDRPLPPGRAYPGPVLRLGLRLDPAINREWISTRAEQQVEAGLLDEAASLRAQYPETLRSFSTIGYREAFAVLDGTLDRAGLIVANSGRNSAYARRQRTWFRAQPGFLWLDAAMEPFGDARVLVEAFLESI